MYQCFGGNFDLADLAHQALVHVFCFQNHVVDCPGFGDLHSVILFMSYTKNFGWLVGTWSYGGGLGMKEVEGDWPLKGIV